MPELPEVRLRFPDDVPEDIKDRLTPQVAAVMARLNHEIKRQLSTAPRTEEAWSTVIHACFAGNLMERYGDKQQVTVASTSDAEVMVSRLAATIVVSPPLDTGAPRGGLAELIETLSLALPRAHREEIVGDFVEALAAARTRGRWAISVVVLLKMAVTVRAAIGIRFADLVASRKNTQA